MSLWYHNSEKYQVQPACLLRKMFGKALKQHLGQMRAGQQCYFPDCAPSAARWLVLPMGTTSIMWRDRAALDSTPGLMHAVQEVQRAKEVVFSTHYSHFISTVIGLTFRSNELLPLQG